MIHLIPSIRVTSATRYRGRTGKQKTNQSGKKKKKSRIAIRFSHTFVDRSAIISVTVERQNDGAPRRSIPTGLCPCKSAKHAPVGGDSTGRAICRIALDRKRGDQQPNPADNRVTCTVPDKSLLHKYRSKLCNRRSKRPSSQKALLVASLKAARLICNFLSGSTLRANASLARCQRWNQVRCS